MPMPVANFSAGPATLPPEVIAELQQALGGWQDGLSIAEVSHRSAAVAELIQQSKALVRELLAVPDNYSVVFLPGGARTQFAMIPLNFAGAGVGNYLVTGLWSKLAYQEAKHLGQAHQVTDVDCALTGTIPDCASWQYSDQPSYLHLCSNETIIGLEFPELPQLDTNIPLIVDASSNIFSRPMAVADCAMIYACAQKNFGIAGISLAIIRDDFLAQSSAATAVPSMLSYSKHVAADSRLNTTAVVPLYASYLMLRWMQQQGGLEVMQQLNQQKAKLLYDVIDTHSCYHNNISPQYRSLMNVHFKLPNADLDQKFVAAAAEQGLVNLRGHKSTGGVRASIYNAMPLAGVERLASFMDAFAQQI